jgi:hypothetical protein
MQFRWTSIRISCLWPSDEIRKSLDLPRIVIAVAARRYISIHSPCPHLNVTLNFFPFHFSPNPKKVSVRMCSKCRRKIFLFAFDSIFYMTSSAWVKMRKVTWKINVWKCENFDGIEHRSVNRFQINTAEILWKILWWSKKNGSFFVIGNVGSVSEFNKTSPTPRSVTARLMQVTWTTKVFQDFPLTTLPWCMNIYFQRHSKTHEIRVDANVSIKVAVVMHDRKMIIQRNEKGTK